MEKYLKMKGFNTAKTNNEKDKYIIEKIYT